MICLGCGGILPPEFHFFCSGECADLWAERNRQPRRRRKSAEVLEFKRT